MPSKKHKLGFTLIETILAISVIGLVITAAASLTQNSLRIGRSSMNQFIAYHLAEEGLEIVRNVRDSNWLANRPWRYGFTADGEYVIREGLPHTLEMISDAAVRLGLAEKISLRNSEEFERTIKIDSVKNAARITSTVTYTRAGEQKNVALVMDLTDWKKGPL